MVQFQYPTPYINPAILLSAATGISWSSIPTRQASPEQQLAEQYNICARATAMADAAANQVLRATVNTETLKGPGGARFQAHGAISTLILSRAPILGVTGAQVASAAAFPLTWRPIPASMFQVNAPALGLYGSSAPGDSGEWGQQVTLGGGYVPGGRGSVFLEVVYANGWPHASLTADAAIGDTTISVDDCTGWIQPNGTMGAAGVLYDPAGGQEIGVATAASAAAGPGTLTLSAPLASRHQTGVIFSALPAQIQWAVILFAIAQALTRGATATTVQTISPSGTRTGDGADELMRQAYELIDPYKRTR